MSKSIIEDCIDDIVSYVNGCKTRAFSTSDIIVNREDLIYKLDYLRKNTPEEIKHYQKIIAQKEAILADAMSKADAMKVEAERHANALLEQATQEHNQMISEHEIYLRAQARADEQVNMAMTQAQGIIDRATMEANALKDAANRYMEEVLNHLEKIISAASQSATTNYNKTMRTTEESFRKLLESLGEYETLIQNNIKELHPEENVEAAEDQQQQMQAEATEEDN